MIHPINISARGKVDLSISDRFNRRLKAIIRARAIYQAKILIDARDKSVYFNGDL